MSGILDYIKSSSSKAIDDYSQLIDKDSPLYSHWLRLKSNISQQIPPQSAFTNPQEMQDWSMSAALNAPMGLTFFNSKSPLWNAASAKKAEHMLDLGVDPDLVAKLTGTFKTHTGELVQEFSDASMKIPEGGDKYSTISYGKSELHNPEFEKHFPELYPKIDATITKHALDNGGYYDAKVNQLFAKGGSLDDTLDATAHEFQHAGQYYQGRQHGGNPDMWKDPDRYNNALEIEKYDKQRMYKKMEQLENIIHTTDDPKLAEEAQKRWTSMFENLSAIQKDPNPVGTSRSRWAKYNRIYGEAEARTSAERRLMTEEQRKSNNPFTKPTFGGVPIDMLLVYGKNGNLYSLEKALKYRIIHR